MKLKGKVVIITGASSGIGLACVKDFFACGAKIVLAARRADLMRDIVAQLDPAGQSTLVVPTDVTDEQQCRELVSQTVARFGRLDVLVNNAGLSMRANFGETNLDVLRRLMDVNFWGTVYCTKYALPHILQSKGTIVGITSVAGYIGLPGRTGYSASKFAMRGFLETVRNENMRSGMHVLIVAPGFTASEVRKHALTADGSPQGETPRDESKMMTAGSVAHAIRKGIERNKRSVVLTFVNGKLCLLVNKMFPAFIARVAYREMLREHDSPIRTN